MYYHKEGLAPTTISKLISDHTIKKLTKTRNQLSDQTLSIVGFRNGDLLYNLVQQWNNSNLSLKDSTFDIKSISKRINYFQSQNYTLCDKESCYNCFCTKETYQLEEYMKR